MSLKNGFYESQELASAEQEQKIRIENLRAGTKLEDRQFEKNEGIAVFASKEKNFSNNYKGRGSMAKPRTAIIFGLREKQIFRTDIAIMFSSIAKFYISRNWLSEHRSPPTAKTTRLQY